ncbi:hypothetical protein PPTG_12293 [Phytophthora nicotianae INRA-310]|uniref:Tc1-like transposase DDE domain-containing protein n=1 Tax=Phytophthora nicotianae (strain INRA-310) TaxID=761204 RepID=W2Q5V1_PHYN3|nr:hypothetical protein PPTG_12293 [Phytophthora nicotianae INRA-310]ETN08522.1 hypothetical protein PPTG_12293 [Phytophthora nicotianae INRA-310]
MNTSVLKEFQERFAWARPSAKVTRIFMSSNSGVSVQNIKKRKDFADSLLAHARNGSFIVYYDETNYDTYCKQSQGRALIGERAVIKLPPSKGANLQLQCAISPEVGLVHWAKQRGSIKMEANAAFVDDVYDGVKATDVYRDFFVGKAIVIILDNAPAHSQSEDLIKNREDLELLRLGPYSPMCNPIEGCFSVLKAWSKAFLVFNADQMFDLPYGDKTEWRMRLLENAADHCIECMDLRLVNRVTRHSAHAVAAAVRNEPMQYGL